jgi:hypothetical protein
MVGLQDHGEVVHFVLCATESHCWGLSREVADVSLQWCLKNTAQSIFPRQSVYPSLATHIMTSASSMKSSSDIAPS